ncbi:hypothetical protein [Chitinophaga sp. MM2321]|uniref:hypothetical protein n=1 Tax=Chitinophaga sp. MM2321 TaxID=3137178 RepID=UPI0032D59E78
MKLQGLSKILCAGTLLCIFSSRAMAQQLKLGTSPTKVNASALLELESKKQALLLPRITDTTLITSPADGMIIFLDSDNTLRVRANNYWAKMIREGIQPVETGGTGLGTLGAPGTALSVNTAGNGLVYTPFVQSQQLVSQPGNFWLGGTGKLDGTMDIGGTSASTSGLTLTGLGTAPLANPVANVLSVDAQGKVLVTKNAASNNWLMSGNSGATGSVLGTNDDVKMVIQSNAQPYLEFGRRLTLGLTDTYADYGDDNQKVTYLQSALQFEAPGASFYKPMFFIDPNGNFRMKGSAAGTDYFEFGATGTNNDGGMDFIIGDDGDEPIIFKYYNYSIPATTEIMRLQAGKVGIGLTGMPDKIFHIDVKNDAIRLQRLGTNGTGNPLVIDANGDVKQASQLDDVDIGPATRASGAFTTIAGKAVSVSVTNATTNNLNIGMATLVKLVPTRNLTITGITNGGSPIDGQIITLYNTSTYNITFSNGGATSTVGNRFNTLGANTVTSGPGSITLIYSATDSSWIVTAFVL